MTLTKKQVFSLILFVVLLLALPVAIFLTQKRQDIRPRALQGKANLLMSSDKNSSSVGESINVLVSLQLTEPGLKVSGIDFMILYDKEKLDVVNILPALDTVIAGGVFSEAPVVTSGGIFDDTFNFLRIVELAKMPGGFLPSGAIPLATITFRSIGEGSAVVKFPEDNKYIEIVGTGVYNPQPTCTPEPPCLYSTPPCKIDIQLPPGGWWCPPPPQKCSQEGGPCGVGFPGPNYPLGFCCEGLICLESNLPDAGGACVKGDLPAPTITPGGPTLTPTPTVAPVVFNFTGSNQTYTVPAGVTQIRVKMWGAGGGGRTYSGGGGGYTSASIAVTPAETLAIIVGGGGTTNITGGYGGGGNGGSSGFSGGGGGRTAIRRGETELVAAGGGGGGTGDSSCFSGSTHGGAGGGVSGQSAGGGGGGGGTQSAGGVGGHGTYPGHAGTQFSGGAGDDSYYGGGGGGGYFGGGGGSWTWGYCYGGGGGSGYIDGTGVTEGDTSAGSGTTPGNASDSDRGNAGNGGGNGQNGQPGKVVILL